MAHIRLFTPEFMRDLQLPPTPRNPSKSKKKGEATFIDTLEPGKALVLRTSYGGSMTWKVMFYVKTTNAEGNAITAARAKKLGHYPAMSVSEAYAAARKFDPKKGAASFAAGTFGKAAEKWQEDNTHLRSYSEVKRHLESYVLPQWGEKSIYDLRRREVNELLDQIKKKRIRSPHTKKLIGGISQADAVLATIRGVMMSHAKNDDDYVHPIPLGMSLKTDKRTVSEKWRKRVLTDDEIRAVWTASGKMGNYGALVRLLLLTAQRLRKVAGIRRSEVADDGTWTIRREPREKGNAGIIRLPRMALDIIEAQPTVAGNEHIFPAAHGKNALSNFSQIKDQLDDLMALADGTENWTFHDLRRTARTRMGDIGIDDKTAERILGHTVKESETQPIYKLSKLVEEKSAALDRLATHIADVLNPTPAKMNVVPLRQA